MPKLIATVIATVLATIALLFGGPITLATTAEAVEKSGCKPGEACEVAGPCEPGEPCEAPASAPTCQADETVSQYRALIATQAEWIEREADRFNRLQRVADRRAATIARLRAKIRALR